MRYSPTSLLKRFVGFAVPMFLFMTTDSAYSQTYNYAEVLQKSIFFYECQLSGPKPSWNRVSWRGNSTMDDGKDVGKNLTGGWLDAGDNVKFNFPMAYTATILALSVVEFEAAYVQTRQYTYIMNNLRFVCDYFIKCHTAKNELYGQVGAGNADHAWWGPVEALTMDRPSYKIDDSRPGSDLAGETAAALAAASIAFKSLDPAYSATLLQHAKELYDFADSKRGIYTDAITDAKNFYNSWSGYMDELVWGAIWLYKATNDAKYLTKAETVYDSLGLEQQTTFRKYKWTHCWDDKAYGSYTYMAMLTGKDYYKQDVERWLDYWTTGFQGQKINYSPGGLAWLDTWGSLRYASNTALFALLYSDYLKANGGDAAKISRYHDFAVKQINYCLGDNPGKRSFVCGFGTNPPLNPHHRTAHGSWSNSINSPAQNRHILYGALVGGPDQGDKYTDDRTNYTNNEVACDYNAGFTAAIARMVKEFGGQSAGDFPVKEKAEREFFVSAKVNATGNRFIEISAKMNNQSAWPAKKATALSFRYYVDISEVLKAGNKMSDITVTSAFNQGAKISPLIAFDQAKNIYYVEISFQGIAISPSGQSESKKEVQFRLALPSNNNNPDWDNTNDWSYDAANLAKDSCIEHIPVYDSVGGAYQRVFGIGPGDGPPNPTDISTNSLGSWGNPLKLNVKKTNGSLFLTFDSQKRQTVNVSLLSANGKTIGSIVQKELTFGLNTLNMNSQNIPAGVLFLNVQSSTGSTQTIKLQSVK